MVSKHSKQRILLLSFSLMLSLLAISRVHVGVQSTLIGYQLGELKGSENKLLDKKTKLSSQLAELSTQKNLALMAGKEASVESKILSASVD